MYGSMIFSSVLAFGESNDVCLYEVLMFVGFEDLGIGIIFAIFHI